jgi:hypothetical protein
MRMLFLLTALCSDTRLVLHTKPLNRIGGVMVSVLAPSVVDYGFEPLSG